MAWNPELEAAFTPRSVAVLGASTQPWGGGNFYIRGSVGLGFEGKIYPINPNAEEVLDLKCYPSLAAVPEVPDLVVVAVGAGRAEQALEECIAKGARNIHMFTAGFAETGEEEGEALAERLRAIAKRGKLNIIGPNCMGIYSPRGRISSWADLPTETGPVAMITQSGALAGEFVHMAPGHGLLMSKVISFGNGYVLDSTDYLEYFENDPETKYIAMYLEGVRDGRKLLAQVRRISLKKPVVIMKGGLTSAGARAAASHTGALAGEGAVWEAFFAQSGAIRVDSLEEMVDVLQALVLLPPCTGRNVCLVGNAGGTGVAAADTCSRNGLNLPTISDAIQEELRSFIGLAGTSVRNPMDVGMQVGGPDGFVRVLETVAKDPAIDMFLMVMHVFARTAGWRRGTREMLKILLKFLRGSKRRKRHQPFCLIIRRLSDSVETERNKLSATRTLVKAGVPVFDNVERACRALYGYTGYYRWLAEQEER